MIVSLDMAAGRDLIQFEARTSFSGLIWPAIVQTSENALCGKLK